MSLVPDAIGWAATAIFAASYFIKARDKMRAMQAAAAVVWMLYGAVIHSLPVIVANLMSPALPLIPLGGKGDGWTRPLAEDWPKYDDAKEQHQS